MKINRKSLMEAMKVASKVCEKKSNIPVLATVLLDGEKQCLHATDLEVYLEYPLEISDCTHESKVEREEIPEEFQVIPQLNDLTGPQLKNLADDYGIELPTKAKVGEIRAIILDACLKADRKDEGSKVYEKFCLPCDRFKKILETLEEDDVEIIPSISDGASIFSNPPVCIGENFSALYTMDASEFPEVEILKDGFETFASVDRKMLDVVAKASSREKDHGYNLSVVHFDREKKSIVSTDGHRMHWAEVPEFSGDKDFEFPVSALRVVDAAFKPSDLVVMGYNHERKMIRMMLGENAVLLVRAFESRFPDWNAVMPKNDQHSITIKRQALEKPLKQTLTLANDRYRAVALKFNGGIDVESFNPDIGGYQKTSIPVSAKSYPDDVEIKIGMNTQYLLEAMKPIKSDDLEIQFETETKPIFMGHENFHALVMPTRA